jgi:IS30 family transposase
MAGSPDTTLHGAELCAFKQKHELSVRELSDALGYSASTLYRWMKNGVSQNEVGAVRTSMICYEKEKKNESALPDEKPVSWESIAPAFYSRMALLDRQS